MQEQNKTGVVVVQGLMVQEYIFGYTQAGRQTLREVTKIICRIIIKQIVITMIIIIKYATIKAISTTTIKIMKYKEKNSNKKTIWSMMTWV